MDSQVAKLTAAAHALAEIETPRDAVGVIRLAEAARVFARQAELGGEAENAATAIRLKAEIRLAETVEAGQKAGEIAGAGQPSNVRDADNTPATLSELGVSRQRLSEAREIAGAFTLPAIDGMAEDANVRGTTLTRAAVLREARNEADDRLIAATTTEEDRHREKLRQLQGHLGRALTLTEEVASSLTADERSALVGQVAYLHRRAKGTYDDEAFEDTRTRPRPRAVG